MKREKPGNQSMVMGRTKIEVGPEDVDWSLLYAIDVKSLSLDFLGQKEIELIIPASED